MSLIDHKKQIFIKDGNIDAASRLGHQGDLYSDQGEIKQAI